MRSGRDGRRTPRKPMTVRHRTRSENVPNTQSGKCPMCRTTAATTLAKVHASGACNSARRSKRRIESFHAEKCQRSQAAAAMRRTALRRDAHTGQQQPEGIQLRVRSHDPPAQLRQPAFQVTRPYLVEFKEQRRTSCARMVLDQERCATRQCLPRDVARRITGVIAAKATKVLI